MHVTEVYVPSALWWRCGPPAGGSAKG